LDRLKIAVSSRLLVKNQLEGIGWFNYEVFKRLTEKHSEVDFYFIFDRDYHSDFIFGKNVHPIKVGIPSRHPVLWYKWFHLTIPKLLKRLKPDVFISPDGYIPLNTRIKTLAIIHDIAYMHYPEFVNKTAKHYYKYFFPKYANSATRVATVSKYSMEDIHTQFGVSKNKIDVVYNGYNTDFNKSDNKSIESTKSKYGIKSEYFVYLGGLNPRKNLIRLVEAFDKFRSLNLASNSQLLLIGKQGYKSSELINRIALSPFNKDIIQAGRVNDFEELKDLISGAIALTYVSVFEGFGIPCLEAMACGVPVLVSNTSSMPEVCGKAGLYIDPLKVDSITEAMTKIFINPDLRLTLIEEGYQQIRKFSWDITSELVWESVLKTINTNE